MMGMAKLNPIIGLEQHVIKMGKIYQLSSDYPHILTMYTKTCVKPPLLKKDKKLVFKTNYR